MRTPVPGTGLKQYDDLPPVEAVIKAWTLAGYYPEWHHRQKTELYHDMPLLARALDRLVATHKDNS